jgi:hypothetical protein
MNVKLLTAEQFKNEKCYTPDEVAAIVTRVLANNPSLETLFGGRPRPDAAKQKESILKELYEQYVMTTVTAAANQTAAPVEGEPTVTNE